VTFTGYTHSTYGDVYVADLATYNGDKASESDYGTFDETLGIFTIPTIYYVSAGYFGYGPEYLYIDGISRADYTSLVTYSGIFTDASQNVFAVGELVAGADVTVAKAVVMEASADAAAVADAIAAGELEATDVAPGSINVPIPDGMTGNLQLIAVVVVDGEVKSYSSAPFEYYGGGASPWKSLGTGLYTDDFIVSLYGYDPYTYEVEIEENTETPGLYRMKSAYAPLAAAFGTTGGNANIVVNAVNPSGVYVPTQATGLDLGDGEFSIVSVGGDYVEYYASKYTAEEIIAALPQYFGTIVDGVITLPAIARTDSEGNPKTDADGNQLYYQGYTYIGTDGYYAGKNGGFKVVLPSAVTASAKRAAASSRRAQEFANRLNGGAMKQKITKHLKTAILISGRNIR